MKYLTPFFSLLLITLFLSCHDSSKENSSFSVVNPSASSGTNVPTKLDDYWYQGKAEINSYDLQQARYRDIHPGEAVLVFVTEDFLTDKQVKNDTYTNKNSTSVLKTNFMRKFTTGIYDYSIMTSVFTPVDTEKHPKTMKVTMSSQDWCGQSFMQINQKNSKYRAELRSYFEKEGDKDFSMAGAILEDEIFNRIRMNPDKLPTGNTQMIPSTTVARLVHFKLQPMNVKITKEPYNGSDFSGAKLTSYTIEYPSLNRTLSIVYQNKTPYLIEGWTDTYPNGSGQPMTTIAKRKETLVSPYWQQNGKREVAKRTDLGLITFE